MLQEMIYKDDFCGNSVGTMLQQFETMLQQYLRLCCAENRRCQSPCVGFPLMLVCTSFSDATPDYFVASDRDLEPISLR